MNVEFFNPIHFYIRSPDNNIVAIGLYNYVALENGVVADVLNAFEVNIWNYMANLAY